jgi:hypothetical protein
MKTQNNIALLPFTVTLLVDQSPAEVFAAVINVRGWWTENTEGSSEKLHDEFEVRFEDMHYSKQLLTEVIPGKKVVWLVTDSKLSFIKDKEEWTGTGICFEIARRGNKTELHFTHLGLVPEYECYNACSGAWGDYISISLYNLITTGRGNPDAKAGRK